MNRVWFFPSDWKSELEQLRNLKVLWRSSVTSLKIRSVCRKSALFSNMLWVSTCLKICCMSQWEEVLNFLNWGGFCPPWGRARRSSHSCSSTTQWWLEPCEPGPSCVLGGAWAVSFLGMMTGSRCRDVLAIRSPLCLVNLCLTMKVVSCVTVR